MQPELIADYACVVGEGPTWHELEQRLYWTDIDTGRLFRYDPATGHHECFYNGDVVGGFTVQEDGALLLFMARGTVKRWQDCEVTTILAEIEDERDSRFNDVIADPRGRVFGGTMATDSRKGSLYRLDTDGSITRVVTEVGCSNGIGFTGDRKRMYYTDSFKREVDVFDYDEESGALTNRRLFVRSPESEGFPDGLTVDAEDHVWSARWDGGCVVRFDPEGREVMRVPVPAPKASSLTFGGPDYTDIYITTAGGDKKAEDGPHAGALFRINLGIKGRPEFHSRIRVPV